MTRGVTNVPTVQLTAAYPASPASACSGPCPTPDSTIASAATEK